MSDTRVLLVGEDPLALGGLSVVLSRADGLVVVGQAAPAEAAGAGRLHRPDVAAWDLGVDPGPSADTLQALSDASLPVVALLAREELATAALAAGAKGLLSRDVEAGPLAAALLAAAHGLVALDEAFAPGLLRRAATPDLAEPLTPREIEVLQLLAQGLSNRVIASRLGISEHTSKFHVNSILGKLGAQGRTEAVVQAVRLGLILL